jgi:electron transport complex protein RnfB
MDTAGVPVMDTAGVPVMDTGTTRKAAFMVTPACVGCGACLRTCPEHAIRPTAPGSPAPLLVLGFCSGCGECAEICPADACVEVASP